MTSPLLRKLDELPNSRRLLLAALACVATTLLSTPLRDILNLTNIVMLFLLTVLLVAATLGRAAGVLAAFASVLLFDVFFVPPRFSLAVHDAQYLVTFAVMLAVALVTAHLAAGLRRQAAIADARASQTRALYEMARELAGALTPAHVDEITRRFLRGTLDIDAALWLPDAGGTLVPADDNPQRAEAEPVMARLAFEGGVAVNSDEHAGGRYACAWFPLKAPMRVRGVLWVRPLDPAAATLHSQKPLLDTVASLVAIVIERLHYVDVAHASQVETAAERLRSSILSALSHDLRTPLTALVGLADSLVLLDPSLPASARETAAALRDQAVRTSSLVANLLDMARLHAGQITLRREWQPIEEPIGAAINLLRQALGGHPIRVDLTPDLPLLELDAVLMERVFCNLIENAAKYSPAGTPVDIRAARSGDRVTIEVCDRGCGFPADKSGVFGMFVRGAESSKPGVGLGLAICRAIVEAHGGTIEARDRDGGGACVALSLPIGNPPAIEEETIA
jgi:two-component system sensor histidine kinase KdpD